MNDMETRIANGFTDAKTDTTTAENNAKKYADGIGSALTNAIGEIKNSFDNAIRSINTTLSTITLTLGQHTTAINATRQGFTWKMAPWRKNGRYFYPTTSVKGATTITFDLTLRRYRGTATHKIAYTLPLSLFFDVDTNKFKSFNYEMPIRTVGIEEFQNGILLYGSASGESYLEVDTVESEEPIYTVANCDIYLMGNNNNI